MRLITILAAMVGWCCAFGASAAQLSVGDPAPALTVGKWVKGEPVKEIEKGKLYVVEFWATWCGPCKTSIPHLTEMAHKNKDVTFIGVSVWEQDESAVEPFVKEMGDKMDYRVATDDKSKDAEGAMAAAWMKAADQGGIPTAFLVNKDAQIAWIGHPMELEAVLQKVVAGTFDIEEAKKEAAASAAEAEEMQKVQQAFEQTVLPALQKQDFPAAMKAIDELAVTYPKLKPQLLRTKFGIGLQAGQFDLAYAAADEMAAASNDDAAALNELAWLIATEEGIEKRDLDRAQKYAQRAVELTKGEDASILDTLARIQFDKGDVAKAVETQEKAVAAASGELKTELEATLTKYKEKAPK